jgi:hypothetical protein
MGWLAVSVIHAAPSNPNASQKTREMFDYLTGLRGVAILSGQESMFSCGSFPSIRDQYVYEKTGKYPALYASDFGDVATGNLYDRKTVVANAVTYHKKGSIISLQYHMIQPDLPDGSGFSAMNIKGSSYPHVNEILIENSRLNRTFKNVSTKSPVISDSSNDRVWSCSGAPFTK